ncbi:MAG: hypothetical protein IJW31_03390 [Lentisphaeria bacterium]|nr:hypothetical protein [Lentisphaeria bacterium]
MLKVNQKNENSNPKINDTANAAPMSLHIDKPISDNMVWQHGKINRICGTAIAGERVDARINGATYSTFASPYNGRFTIYIPPQAPASGLTLQISCRHEEKTFSDIAFGNVYLIAGQSNMEFMLKLCYPSIEAIDQTTLPHISYFKPQITLFPSKQTEIQGHWEKLDSVNALEFSGLGVFFASLLYLKISIPIGIIDISLGGVNLESWVDYEHLSTITFYRQELQEYELKITRDQLLCLPNLADNDQKLFAELDKMFPEEPHDSGLTEKFYSRDFDDSKWETMRLPDSWTQAGHNHAGIFWFRREIILKHGEELHNYKLHLGAIDKSDITFMNGTKIGESGDMKKFDAWNKKRVYDIPKGIMQAGRNILAIRAASLVSICNDGGLTGPAEEMFLISDDGSIKYELTGIWKYQETFDAGIEGMTCMRKFGSGGPNSFHMFFDNMIYPLAATEICGVIFYQGEANAICMSHTYYELLKNMIASWRQNFRNAELPFYIIQLPNYHNPHVFAPHSQWALIREAQKEAALQMQVDYIVTIGLGEVDELHPRNKLAVAKIITDKEGKKFHNQKTPATPELLSVEKSNEKLILKFSEALRQQAVYGFAVSGTDLEVFAAQAEFIDDYTIAIWSDEVPEAYAVWYAWADNPEFANLVSSENIAVSPFRVTLDGKKVIGKNLVHSYSER